MSSARSPHGDRLRHADKEKEYDSFSVTWASPIFISIRNVISETERKILEYCGKANENLEEPVPLQSRSSPPEIVSTFKSAEEQILIQVFSLYAAGVKAQEKAHILSSDSQLLRGSLLQQSNGATQSFENCRRQDILLDLKQEQVHRRDQELDRMRRALIDASDVAKLQIKQMEEHHRFEVEKLCARHEEQINTLLEELRKSRAGGSAAEDSILIQEIRSMVDQLKDKPISALQRMLRDRAPTFPIYRSWQHGPFGFGRFLVWFFEQFGLKFLASVLVQKGLHDIPPLMLSRQKSAPSLLDLPSPFDFEVPQAWLFELQGVSDEVRELPQPLVRAMVDQMYGERIELDLVWDREGRLRPRMPEFVYSYLLSKYNSRKLATECLRDVIAAVRKGALSGNKQLKMFCQFCRVGTDPPLPLDGLDFFLRAFRKVRLSLQPQKTTNVSMRWLTTEMIETDSILTIVRSLLPDANTTQLTSKLSFHHGGTEVHAFLECIMDEWTARQAGVSAKYQKAFLKADPTGSTLSLDQFTTAVELIHPNVPNQQVVIMFNELSQAVDGCDGVDMETFIRAVHEFGIDVSVPQPIEPVAEQVSRMQTSWSEQISSWEEAIKELEGELGATSQEVQALHNIQARFLKLLEEHRDIPGILAARRALRDRLERLTDS
mmetsp:Transcript_2048/g.3118  ORF Transcript_2048/g.3118 Transcript_2048/m.3118 type:complete len:662 (+) Transcript_2048:76-2061(+)|eukprot:CAMPEP_0184655498 /NCGR_PEP_ID=MMETSP0308-20130426/13098_1 /TAXON_ID=38269 /ORGANISM="Gloeochaete witrockiana, Strain SAG 46.84" /LENGTH=661 /DNA_ID=CAMNT_0027091989 /DNA_START=52 /DNA_END=2037 /DNA_ORIENTATION=+